MGFIQKTVLLILLRRRLESERGMDWQMLHLRDRNWRLGRRENRQWPLLAAWARHFDGDASYSSHLAQWLIALAGLVGGASLMGGLLEFTRDDRINLLWFLILAVLLPVAWWLLALLGVLTRAGVPLLGALRRFLPVWQGSASLRALGTLTAQVAAQQFSLLFAIGMILVLLLYVLLTDLAFGWSSTLDLSAGTMWELTSALSWPWRQLWPDAVPGLPLVEASRYFRSAPAPAHGAALLGQWWRFLFMAMVVYVLLPRVLSYLWMRARLARTQAGLLQHDGLISGLWQRLSSEVVSQEVESVEQGPGTAGAPPIDIALPECDQVLRWGTWREEHWAGVAQRLAAWNKPYTFYATDENSQVVTLFDRPEGPPRQLLIVCKGWEPPTGELADLCQHLHRDGGRYFIWAVPLAGMTPQRVQLLNRSWAGFMPALPDSFTLLTGAPNG